MFTNKVLIISVIALIAFGGVMTAGKTRGIRNNNAGNIRWDNKTKWLGQIGADDKGFIIFSEPVYGIRAMVRVLRSYQNRGIVTLEKIISTWAPPIENNTESYIKSVEQRTGFKRGDVMFQQHYPKLIDAIIYHENGSQPYAMSIIDRGVAIA